MWVCFKFTKWLFNKVVFFKVILCIANVMLMYTLNYEIVKFSS